MEDDIAFKMNKLCIDADAKKIILQDIFGNDHAQVQVKTYFLSVFFLQGLLSI